MVLASHPNPTAPVISHFNLTGKVALVTGGCRGIGLEVARGLAEAGANVAITYTSQKPADADAIAASLAASTGRSVKALKCEVKSRAEVFETVEKVVADKELSPTGRLHVVVANAGTAGNVPALDHPEDRWREMLDINFHGAFWTAQAAAQVFERQWRADGGKEGGAQSRCSIIFTASVSAILVNVPQKQAAYNASKAALVHLAKSLAVEWVDFARVNCISPGFIKTDILEGAPQWVEEKWMSMVPADRMALPEELKGSYVYLASDASSYMTGANLVIDGGYTLP
ncbi:short chain dehydrogenase reductase family [Diaporthe amygdali]|uniref:short chain dehydrogenase reductase family n=1 Tax=Phomopsis amygdali TaxID=1214568 RepID=UPI0022FF300C|nr:short chain dehydrogenase reductase family [Diaporthe amygdali]KAJ0107912.1 short chain dehydrogenase reductase family [Diaporthe amygdali]